MNLERGRLNARLRHAHQQIEGLRMELRVNHAGYLPRIKDELRHWEEKRDWLLSRLEKEV